MPLPRGDEYNQAVQTPRTSFYDSDLKLCQVETTPLGLPKPYSGGFTTTYRLSNHQSSWAVRCFTREIRELQRRYQAIGNFLTLNNSKYFVDARYLEQGIKIGANAYPIIKMKWLDGEPMNNYISKSYAQKSSIEKLLNEFVLLVNHLGNLGIAHGDLQHGNIIIKNNQLYLIDYDGMYFPELASLQTNEIGHPNYQHPQRSSQNYNKEIDRFSAIVIYSGLKAISIQPNLWKKYDNSENILFKSQDFSDPKNSPLFQDLNANTELKKIGEKLIGVCYLEYSRIPTLQTFIDGNFTFPSISVARPPVQVPRNAYLVLDARFFGQILEHIGDRVEIVGKLSSCRYGETRFGKPYYFLNFGIYPHHTFTIVIWSEGISAFQVLGVNPSSFVNKWISVTGVIESYNHKPQFEVGLPSQIQVLNNEEEAKARLQIRHTSSTNNNRPTRTNVGAPEDIWETIYSGRPVTPQPPPTQPRPSTPPQSSRPYPTSSSQQTSRPTSSSPSSSSKKGNGGCAVQIVVTLVAGGIGTAIGGVPGLIIGAIIGGIVSSFFT
jgi:hypothetical protein